MEIKGGVTVEYIIDSSIIIEPFSMKLTLEQKGQDAKVTTFVKDGIMYMSNPINNTWEKQEATFEAIEQFKNALDTSTEIYNMLKDHLDKVDIKEIRFGPQTDEHDYQFKLKHAKEFLNGGNKVRAYVFFRGRSILFKEQGEVLLLRFANDLEEYAKVEQLPKLDGKKMFLYLTPKKAGVVKKSQQKMDRERREAEANAAAKEQKENRKLKKRENRWKKLLKKH